MRLDAGLCVIRPWHSSDLPSLVHHANNPRVWQNLRDGFPHPYTDEDGERWLKFVASHRPESNFAIEVDGKAVGGIGLVLQSDVHRLSAELGYWLGEEYWGRGIVSAAVGKLAEYAFPTYGLVRMFAYVFEWNPASARVLEKNGFVLEGRLCQAAVKNGKIIDELLYARVR